MKLLKKLFQKPEKSLNDPYDLIQDVDMDIIVSCLQDIYYEKMYAEYIAGTLSFKVSVVGRMSDESEILVLCNFDKKDATEEYLFWLAACYTKYKSPVHSHWKKSMEIIRDYEDSVLAFKVIMGIACT